MAIKRVPVCFNLENESQMELYGLCKQKFGENMSGGLRGIIWSYFFNTNNDQPQLKKIESQYKINEMESVL